MGKKLLKLLDWVCEFIWVQLLHYTSHTFGTCSMALLSCIHLHLQNRARISMQPARLDHTLMLLLTISFFRAVIWRMCMSRDEGKLLISKSNSAIVTCLRTKFKQAVEPVNIKQCYLRLAEWGWGSGVWSSPSAFLRFWLKCPLCCFQWYWSSSKIIFWWKKKQDKEKIKTMYHSWFTVKCFLTYEIYLQDI